MKNQFSINLQVFKYIYLFFIPILWNPIPSITPQNLKVERPLNLRSVIDICFDSNLWLTCQEGALQFQPTDCPAFRVPGR